MTPNSSGTATPTGEMEPQGVEQWLERRKKQQSLAQSRYRNRQKEKQTYVRRATYGPFQEVCLCWFDAKKVAFTKCCVH